MPPIAFQAPPGWTPIVVAVIMAVPSTIAAIVALMSLLQSRHNAEVAARTAAAVAANSSKTDTVIEKATEIHILTNSNLSRVQAQLDIANEKISGLQQLLAQLVPVLPATTPVPVPVVDEAVLKKLGEVAIVTDKKLDALQETTDAVVKGGREPG